MLKYQSVQRITPRLWTALLSQAATATEEISENFLTLHSPFSAGASPCGCPPWPSPLWPSPGPRHPWCPQTVLWRVGRWPLSTPHSAGIGCSGCPAPHSPPHQHGRPPGEGRGTIGALKQLRQGLFSMGQHFFGRKFFVHSEEYKTWVWIYSRYFNICLDKKLSG